MERLPMLLVMDTEWCPFDFTKYRVGDRKRSGNNMWAPFSGSWTLGMFEDCPVTQARVEYTTRGKDDGILLHMTAEEQITDEMLKELHAIPYPVT